MAGDYAQTVAASIVKQLEDGTAPWVKPWEPSGLRFIPYNATTGKDYQGGNAIWLMAVAEMKGYSDPRWTTYKQAQSLDAQVMKGEKGTLIQYFKKFDRVPVKDEQGRPVKDAEGNQIYRSVELERPRVFSAVVFNAEQIAGMPKIEARPALAEWERHAAAEQIMTHSGVPIIYRPGDRAFYTVAQDRVTIPEREQFKTADRFYSTALHELGHNAAIRIMPHGLRWRPDSPALAMRLFGIIRALPGTRGVDRRAGTGPTAWLERRRERAPFPSSACRHGCRFGWSRRSRDQARARSPQDQRRGGAGPSPCCGAAYVA